jgi:DNA-directed RNA polymerase specialized sigma24 family protein
MSEDRNQATPGPSPPFPDGEVVTTLRLALDGLPDNQQAAIRLAMVERLTVPEIASKLGSSPADVQAAMRAGLFTLRDVLDAVDRSAAAESDLLNA